jgi:hypothetical protein
MAQLTKHEACLTGEWKMTATISQSSNPDYPIQDINDFPDCLQYINLALSRRHPKLHWDEFEKLSSIYIQKHMKGVGFFTRIVVAGVVTSVLKKYLQDKGIAVLPKPLQPLPHEYRLSGTGLSRLGVLENKVALQKKLAQLKSDNQLIKPYP